MYSYICHSSELVGISPFKCTLICHSSELVGISKLVGITNPLSYWCMMTMLLQYVSVSPGLFRVGNLYTVCRVSYYTGFHVHIHMFFTTD